MHVNTENSISNDTIKQIRKRIGKTQAEVAAGINMDRSYYCRKESDNNDKKFTESELQKIITYFDECDKEFSEKVKKFAEIDLYMQGRKPQEILPKYPDVGHYINIINEAVRVNDLELIYLTMIKTLKLLEEKYKIERRIS